MLLNRFYNTSLKWLPFKKLFLKHFCAVQSRRVYCFITWQVRETPSETFLTFFFNLLFFEIRHLMRNVNALMRHYFRCAWLFIKIVPMRVSTVILFFSILFKVPRLKHIWHCDNPFRRSPFFMSLIWARTVHFCQSIKLPSYLFCPPLFLFPCTVLCRIVFVKPENIETWPNHLSLRFMKKVRSKSFLYLWFQGLRFTGIWK